MDVSRLEKRKQINLRKEFKLLVSKTTRTINIKILHPGAAFKCHWNNSHVFLEKTIISQNIYNPQERIRLKNWYETPPKNSGFF